MKTRMNIIYKIFIGIAAFFFVSCSEQVINEDCDKNEVLDNVLESEKVEPKTEADSCQNNLFRSILIGKSDLDSNAYNLEIYGKNDVLIKSETLDIPFSLSKIDYCTSDYTVVSFACGGPCYSQVFVFTDDRKSQQFAYVQKVSNDPSIIAHIQNEKFESLIVHNLNNGQELIVKNPDLNWMNYGQMDTLYVVGNYLNIEYQTESHETRKKTILIRDIIN